MNRIVALVIAAIVLRGAYAISYSPIFTADFAGIEALLERGDPFNGMPRDGTHGQTVEQFVSSPDNTMSSQSIVEFGNAWMKQFHYLLVFMEANAKCGNETRFEEYALALSGLLRQYDEFETIYGENVLRTNRLRLEYAIARIINDRSEGVLRLSSGLIRRMLPPMLAGNMADCPIWKLKQNTFKTMLMIGAEIERFRIANGRLPETLSQLSELDVDELRDDWGSAINYVHDKSEWKLYNSSGSNEAENSNPAVVIPEIDKISGVNTFEVVFSSNFSAQRRNLFLGNEINTDNPRYRCKLDGHVVRKY